MTLSAADKAAAALGAGALLSTLFALSPGSHLPYDFVQVRGPGLVLLLAAGAVAVAGGLLAVRAVVLAAGAAFLAAAITQLVQLGGGTNWFEGNGSTFSLLLGLGCGLLVVGLVPRRAPGESR
ncbi:hypothetical protein SacmaDRAFT_2529 [Saccharomonospora marina XMU15]|uniref:Uncharacterized protein n=1 Tax=Saccharomonospora marina XMU15 TaxID=882083 RepID=H5WZP0_9PSEU|nr:hypothetical protein [Saccharomonospora marina]EHR50772.1 hypothetical protein SacmaDRAFT_2529 [Saccharomonospora marina XMU15]